MKIVSLTLHRFNRMGLDSLKHLHLDATAVQQIILGTNGWGKSSVMGELSPLPGNKSDFSAGGYKEIVITQDGKRYRLINKFDKPIIHAFIINDGENLNVSRKETEQKALVKEHFGITQALFDVLVGRLLFTDMQSNQRRDWLMSLSGMDFSFLMKLHQSVKDKAKEYGSMVKNLTQRETDESKKLAELGSAAELSVAVQTLREEITLVMQQKTNVDRTVFNDLRLVRELKGIEETALGILELDLRYPKDLPVLECDQSPDELLGVIRARLEFTETKMSELYNRKEKIELVTRSISDTTLTIEDFKVRLAATENSLATFLADPSVFVRNDPTSSNTALIDHIGDSLQEMFSNYPDNRQLRFNGQRREELTARHQNQTRHLNDLRSSIATKQADLQHLTSHPVVDCPECDHRWQPGVEPESIDLLGQQIEKLAIEEVLIEKDIEWLGSELEEFKQFIRVRTAILGVLNRKEPCISQLAERFRALEKDGCHNRMLLELLEQWREDMRLAAKIQSLQQTVEDDRIAIYHAEQIEVHELNDRDNALTSLDKEISDNISAKQLYTAQLQGLGFYIRRVRMARDLQRQLNEACHELDYFIEKCIDGYRDFQLDAYLGRRQSELALNESRLNTITTTMAAIAAIGSFRDESLCKSACAKELQEILSPTSGLIAECITQFMNDFVGDLNYVLSSVWSYDMVIYPCRVDGLLDYKFPIEFGNSGKIRDDIKQTSTAQQKVINLAFRLMVMTQLPGRVFPLYLDEIESGFDETHITSLIMFIRNFVESGQCSQLFMISHDVGTHGAFPNAQYCVIGSDNIVNLPSVYNQHVVMEYY